MNPKPRAETALTEEFIDGVLARLREGKPVRRSLPGYGRLHVDRLLPFIFVYRRPPGDRDEGTDKLVLGEPLYIQVSGSEEVQKGLTELLRGMAAIAKERFGSFLVLEIWASKEAPSGIGMPRPAFNIVRSEAGEMEETVEALRRALGQVKVQQSKAAVAEIEGGVAAPPGMHPLLPPGDLIQLRCRLLGLEVLPIYHDRASGKSYPIIRRALHRGLSNAVRQAFFEFSRTETTHEPPHYHALGRRRMVKAVWKVDQELAEVSHAFDFLLQVTPSNPDAEWRHFRSRRFEKPPRFAYRPRPIDPSLLKRRLFAIPIERIEDPSLAALFRDQQEDLDRRLTMLGDLGTRRFLYGSLQLYGRPGAPLLRLARRILDTVPSRSRDDSGKGHVDARGFAARAEEEIKYYRERHPEVWSRAEVRDDVTGLLVSRGNLLIGSQTRIPVQRIAALLQHEVGTHIVTYFNGRAQPFRQLFVGLPRYEELQEALAVLAEYLAGGLSRPRLRLLAARVVAADRMASGGSFIEVFRELDRKHDFEQRMAFMITMRVFRGGGFTKDIVYLRGLVGLLEYLKGGASLGPLYVGKIGAGHVSIIEELQWRKVLSPMPLRPRYLEDPGFAEKIVKLRRMESVLDLIKRRRQ